MQTCLMVFGAYSSPLACFVLVTIGMAGGFLQGYKSITAAIAMMIATSLSIGRGRKISCPPLSLSLFVFLCLCLSMNLGFLLSRGALRACNYSWVGWVECPKRSTLCIKFKIGQKLLKYIAQCISNKTYNARDVSLHVRRERKARKVPLEATHQTEYTERRVCWIRIQLVTPTVTWYNGTRREFSGHGLSILMDIIITKARHTHTHTYIHLQCVCVS